jgi:hypothetical protein
MSAKHDRNSAVKPATQADVEIPAFLEISGKEKLPPAPDILDALEKDYPLEASIADLVDNSIDAEAKKILIRFVKKNGRQASLYIVDDGRDMDARTLKNAMQFAARRNYGPADLGMFGVGLKTASLSQANTESKTSKPWPENTAYAARRVLEIQAAVLNNEQHCRARIEDSDVQRSGGRHI